MGEGNVSNREGRYSELIYIDFNKSGKMAMAYEVNRDEKIARSTSVYIDGGRISGNSWEEYVGEMPSDEVICNDLFRNAMVGALM